MNHSKLENGGSNLALSQNDGTVQEDLLQATLQMVWRRRWTILVITTSFLMAAFLYLLKAIPIYTSTSRLYVEQNGPRIINEYEGIMTKSMNYLYTQGELMKSTPIIADVVNDPQMRQFRTFANVDNLAAYVKEKLLVSIGRKDDIITLSFDSPYPVEAAEVVNAVVQSYIRYHSSQKRSTVLEVLKILQKEKVKRDAELSTKFQELLAFTRENGIVSLENQGGHIVLERLTRLSTALTEAQLNALNAKADYEATKSMQNEPAKVKQFASASSTVGVRVFVSDTETQLQAELRAAEIELKNARYHCTEDHPSVQAIHAKINRIKEEMDKQAREFADSYIEVMRLRWVAANEREAELQGSVDAQFQMARDLGIKAAEHSVLQSELKRTERLCEILDDRIKELNVTEDTGALNISILDVARPADHPSKPEKTKFMAMGLALGLAFGGAFAVLRDMLDSRLRSADEISAALGIPVLGIVPTMSDSKTIALRGRKLRALLKRIFGASRQSAAAAADASKSEFVHAPGGGGNLTENESFMGRALKMRSELERARWMQRSSQRPSSTAAMSQHEPEAETKTAKTIALCAHAVDRSKETPEKSYAAKRGQKVHLDPNSLVAEAYRTIRTAVFFGVAQDQAKTILVTSPAPGDGKSTVASNMAITMAQAGQKTLVIDADLRKPTQHSIFEIESRDEGLSNLLAGAIDMEQAILPGPTSNLDILTCGVEIPNPVEVLNSNAFAGLLRELTERYDRIIIDSPPVGLVSDGQILSALCDVTILVLRAETSTRRHSQQARDSLLSVGGRILGVIVNDVQRGHGHYGYYSGYGRYGSYGYYGQTAEKKKVAV
jgi:capsular exopolysaccharide synthesis family protein